MAVFDHWAYIFAMLLHAPLRVEAAVVAPPPEVMAAQHMGLAPVIVAKPLPKVQCGCLTVRVTDCVHPAANQSPRITPAARKVQGGRSQ